MSGGWDIEDRPMHAQSLAHVFDRSGRVRRPPIRLTLREGLALLPLGEAAPDPEGLPHGNGHIVLLVPGLFTTDAVNRPLQRFLNACGYRAFGWDLGVNWGPTPRLVNGLERRLAELCALEGGAVSVVGLSLGGLFARDLAYRRPRDVRQVVTIASPYHLPTATVLEPLFHVFALLYASGIDVARLSTPLPVPAAAIYSRQDGIVAWESCRREDGPSVEVSSSHFAVYRNPDTLRAVARQLGEQLSVIEQNVPKPA
jgi:pimeloyl-ACP methyl ester carboxylesterase